jgi:hypothetical protein
VQGPNVLGPKLEKKGWAAEQKFKEKYFMKHS